MAYKFTSDVFQISAGAKEATANTPLTTTINLPLDSLSREILVILYVDIDCNFPDLQMGVNSFCQVSLNDSNVGVQGISNPRVIAVAENAIISDATGVVSFQNSEPRASNQTEEVTVFVTATDDLFLSVGGTNNVTRLANSQVRIYARRARADADTYAAILTSQFN